MNTLKVSNFFSLFSTSQKFMITFVVCVVSALVFADEGGSNTAPDKTQKKLVMEESEWKKKLSPEQYRILRQAGTERPFGDVYKKFKDQGLGKYVCAGCDTELFSSNEKFDSKCGWPSFYDPSKAKNVKTSVDYLLGYPRTEVLCAVCDGHLGHVFTGEGFDTPTDKRYCINGTVLKFIPAKKEKTVKNSKP
jgi:peptide-methionine (R)-S-oxide reductase|tara:strand:+ start:649 stop:1224 length:576 start_codon:yes stop_codon:yes gene_type:complete